MGGIVAESMIQGLGMKIVGCRVETSRFRLP